MARSRKQGSDSIVLRWNEASSIRSCSISATPRSTLLSTCGRRPGSATAAAAALPELRHADGSNQLGGYVDSTGYAPVNLPMDVRFPFDPPTVLDASRWQPLRYVNPTGAVVAPAFIAPHWNRVTPFGSALRSPVGPARAGTPAAPRAGPGRRRLEQGDVDARVAGRSTGAACWDTAQGLLTGDA